MKKRKKKTLPKLIAPIPFRDIKFNKSFILILLAILILVISFILYSNYGTDLKEYEIIIEKPLPPGDECILDSDCPQPRCPGIKSFCETGYCITREITPSKTRCIDLKIPVCGNEICEGNEEIICPEDCL